MRIKLVSDLHVENWRHKPFDWAGGSEDVDVLVIAGDVSDTLEETRREIAGAAQHYPLVLWLPGNHEAFHFGSNLGGFEGAVAALVLPSNVKCLGVKQTYLHQNILFVGALGWWDYTCSAPEATVEETKRLLRQTAVSDGWFGSAPASGEPIDEVVAGLAQTDYEYVRDCVKDAQTSSSVRAIIIVTHSAPHRSLIRKGQYPKDASLAGLYCNSLMENIQEFDNLCKIRFWFFGHIHSNSDAAIGHVRFVGSPRGRPDDFGRDDYKGRIISLELVTNIPPEAPLEVAPAHAPVKRLPKTSSFEVTGVVGGAPGGPGKVTL